MPKARVSGCQIAHLLAREIKGEESMFIVKVTWDAHNQAFRLVDQKLTNMFEDGDMYLLVVDFSPQHSDTDEQFIDLDQAEIGHA
jgi:hypothetical protein